MMKFIEKILWAVLIIFLILACGAQIIANIVSYFHGSTTTEVQYVQSQKPLPLPSLMLCPRKPMNQESIINFDADSLVDYMEALRVPKTTDDGATDDWDKATTETLQKQYQQYINEVGGPLKAYENLGWKCEETFAQCQKGGHTFNCCNSTSVVPSIYGPCLYVNASHRAANQPMMVQSILGQRGALTIDMDLQNPTGLIDLTGGSVRNNVDQFGSWLFLVDRWKYNPTDGIPINMNQETNIGLQLTEQMSLEQHIGDWKRRYKHLENIYERLIYQKDRIGLQDVHKPDCYSVCLSEHMIKNCSCAPFYFNLALGFPNKFVPESVEETHSAANGSSNGEGTAKQILSMCNLTSIHNCVKPLIQHLENASEIMGTGNSVGDHLLSAAENVGKWNPLSDENGANGADNIDKRHGRANNMAPFMKCQRRCKMDEPFAIDYKWTVGSFNMPPLTPTADTLPARLRLYFITNVVVVTKEYSLSTVVGLLSAIALTICFYVIVFIIIWAIVQGLKTVCCGCCGGAKRLKRGKVGSAESRREDPGNGYHIQEEDKGVNTA